MEGTVRRGDCGPTGGWGYDKLCLGAVMGGGRVKQERVQVWRKDWSKKVLKLRMEVWGNRGTPEEYPKDKEL